MLIGVAALGGVGFAGYKKLGPQPVVVVSPHIGPAIEAVYATGTVEPTVMVALAPKLTARLSALNADEGQKVRKGQILARFEDTDLQATITQLQAQVTLAEKELERKEKLVKQKYISTEAYDQAVATLATAQAALQQAEAQSDYLKLVAPTDATVIRRDGEIGEVLTPTGTPLFYLSADSSPLRISAEVDEEDIVHVEQGQKVLIQSDAFPDKVFEGKVMSITPMGDSVSRSYRVRVALPENCPLMIGMTAETNIVYKEKDEALLIPLSSVNSDRQIEKLVDGKIVIEKVTLGVEGKDNAEVKNGASKQDKIVVPFNPDLKNGDRVRATTRP